MCKRLPQRVLGCVQRRNNRPQGGDHPCCGKPPFHSWEVRQHRHTSRSVLPLVRRAAESEAAASRRLSGHRFHECLRTPSCTLPGRLGDKNHIQCATKYWQLVGDHNWDRQRTTQCGDNLRSVTASIIAADSDDRARSEFTKVTKHAVGDSLSHRPDKGTFVGNLKKLQFFLLLHGTNSSDE